jgi:hypothetical protein
MPVELVDELAAQGVTRIVVNTAATDPDEQRAELSAFARRFGLAERIAL